MFNPTNLDEVCLQATHIESRGKNTYEEDSKKNSPKGKQKEKGGKWKGKKNASVKKEGRKSHANIVPKRGMMKPTAGNRI